MRHFKWAATIGIAAAALVGCKGAELPPQAQFVGVAGGDAAAPADSAADGGGEIAAAVDAADSNDAQTALDVEIGDAIDAQDTLAPEIGDAMDAEDVSAPEISVAGDAQDALAAEISVAPDSQDALVPEISDATDAQDALAAEIGDGVDAEIGMDAEIADANDAATATDVAPTDTANPPDSDAGDTDDAAETSADTQPDAPADVPPACTAPCSDGNPCTDADACKDGNCVGTAKNCDDGNACTDDSCDKTKGCVNLPNTATCDDGQLCIDNDKCGTGKCSGTAKACGDGNACTDDSCDKTKGCVSLPNTATCDDGDACTSGEKCADGACSAVTSYIVAEAGGSQPDRFLALTALPDGGWVAGGQYASATQGWVVRYDGNGKVKWELKPDPAASGADGVYGMASATDGSVAAVGVTGSGSAADGWFARIDAAGKITSEAKFGTGTDYFNAVAPLGTGWLLAGATAATGAKGDGWLVAVSDSGTKVWEKVAGGAKDDTFSAVLALSPALAVAGGSSRVNSGNDEPSGWLLWVDGAGNTVRERLIGAGTGALRLNHLAKAPATGIWPAGLFAAGDTAGTGQGDAVLYRFDSDGTVLWQKVVAATANQDGLNGVVATADGGCVVAGFRGLVSGNTAVGEAIAAKYDAAGNQQWLRSYTTAGQTVGITPILALDSTAISGAGLVFGGWGFNGVNQQGEVWRTDAFGFSSCKDAGKCAGISAAKCDDSNPCTADDCKPSDGSCTHANHTGACDGKTCSEGDTCSSGSCKAGGKPKLWDKTTDPGSNQFYLKGLANGSNGAVVGAYSGTGGADTRVISKSASGDPVWDVALAKAPNGKPLNLQSIDQIADGSFVVAGSWQDGDTPRRYAASVGTDGAVLAQYAESVEGNVSAVAARPDGGWLLAGKTAANGIDNQAFLARYKGDGTPVWSQVYGGAGSEGFAAVKAIPGGGAVAAGFSTTDSVGLQDGYVVGVDAAGKAVWSGHFGSSADDWFGGIVGLPNGGLAASGTTGGKGAGLYDGWLARFDGNGALLWEKFYGGATTNEFANSIAALPDGGFLLGGTVAPGPTAIVDPNSKTGQGWLLHTDGDGNVLWQTKLAGGPNWNSIDAVLALPDGSFAVGGYRGAAGNFDAWVARVDAWGLGTCALAGVCTSIPFGSCKDGNGPCAPAGCDPKLGCAPVAKADGSACDDGKPCSVNDQCFGGSCEAGDDGLWDKAWGTPVQDLYNGAAALPNGSIAVAGIANNDGKSGNYLAHISLADTAGNKVWSKDLPASAFGKTGGADFFNVGVLPDGTLLAVGTAGNGADGDAITYRVDAAGTKLSAGVWPDSTSGFDDFRGLTVDENGVLYLVGSTSTGGGDAWLSISDAKNLGNGPDKTLGGGGSDSLYAATPATGGGVLAVGWLANGSGQDALAYRAKPDGSQLWQVVLDLGANDAFLAAATVSGGYLVGGYTDKPGGAGGQDFWVVRLNLAGKVVWQSTTGGSLDDIGISMLAAGDDVWLAGYSHTAKGDLDAMLLRFNAAGGLLAKTTYGGAKDDAFYTIVSSAGALALTGSTKSKGAGADDGWIVRTDLFGNTACAASGNCLSSAAACDDKNPCTIDTCSGSAPCGHSNVADGTACGTAQFCKAGVCGL